MDDQVKRFKSNRHYGSVGDLNNDIKAQVSNVIEFDALFGNLDSNHNSENGDKLPEYDSFEDQLEPRDNY